MPERVRLPNNWEPRPYQRDAWAYLHGGGKRACLVWHRRAGKDDLCLHWTACAAFERPATYWHMLPQAAQARKAIWEAVDPHSGQRRIDLAFPARVRRRTNEAEMLIELVNGSIWRVVGSDNYDALVGSPPAGVVLSEWALADPTAWAYLSPILAENGGWAVFAYTPRGKNHGWSLYQAARRDPDWHCELRTVDDTGVIDRAALIADLRDKQALYGAEQGRALWDQEWYCSFEAAVQGAYWGGELRTAAEEGRITRVPVDRAVPVTTAWDIGIDDATAIWFAQVVGREVRVIDYHEESGRDAAHYVDVLRERGYRYAEHLLPHDAERREIGTGKSYAQLLREAGIEGSVRVLARTRDLLGDINAVRRFLGTCWFDEERCGRGLEALRQYRREWDDRRHTWRQTPLHDWTSHAADAFRLLASGLRPAGGAGDTSQPLAYRPLPNVA